MADAAVRDVTPTSSASRDANRALRILAAAVYVTLGLLLVQAVLAGVFVSDTYSGGGGDGWVTAHGVVADAIWFVALLAAVYALVRIRRTDRIVVVLAAGYFALALVETAIGHLISDSSLLGVTGNRNGLIMAHIPIAIALFALGGYVATRATQRMSA